MLSSGRRLRAEEVREVIRRGKTLRGSFVSVKLLADVSPLRSAAVVKKSLVRGAVGRNRLRRGLYRALATGTRSMRGRAVFFIDTIPQGSLTPLFREDIERLFPSA
jgi:ribonuclease P protein component